MYIFAFYLIHYLVQDITIVSKTSFISFSNNLYLNNYITFIQNLINV